MNLLKKLKNLALQRFIPLTLFFFLLSSVLFGQNEKMNKKTKKADDLLQKALVLSDSAKYDSAIVLLTEASAFYKKKKNKEKYIHCKNEIIKQSRYIKFNDELLKPAKENIVYSKKILGNEHYLTGNCYSLLGNIFADINKIDSALHYYSKAKEIWELDKKKNKMRIADANLNIGNMLKNKGEFDKAASLIHKALKTKIDSLGNNHPDIAAIYNSLGVMYYYTGDIDSCAFYLMKMLEIRKNYYGESHPIVANAYNNVGVAYKVKGDYDKALTYYKKALDIRKKSLGLLHPNLALSYSNIGVIYANLGKYKLANEYYEKALKIRLELFGEDHIDVAACYTNMGINCMDCGEGGSALLYIQKAFKIIIETYGQDNPNTSSAYNNMGAAYVYGLGDLDKALKYFIRGLELRLKTDANNPLIASSYNNIGAVYKNRGDYELALSYYKNGLKVIKDQFGEQHIEAASAYNNMGEAYLLLNDFETSRKYFEKALNIRLELFGDNYPGLAETYLNIGTVYSKLGELEKEKECYEKGLEICLKNFDERNISAARLYLNLAMNAADMKNYHEAISLTEKALSVQKEIYPEDHPGIAKSLSNLGLIYYLSGNYDLSANYYLKSLDANYIGKLTDNLDYYLILDEIQYLETLSELADLYFTKYKLKNDIPALKEAISYYQKASDMVSFLASGYSVEASKMNLLKKAAGIFQKALISTEILYRNNKNYKNTATAFGFSEQNKSSVLYESIIRSNIKTENTSDSLWVLQLNLSGKINYLKTKFLADENDSLNLQANNEHDAELSKAIIDYQSVTEDIQSRKQNAQYVVFYKQTLIDSIQANLKPVELMLEYFISDSAVYCFVIGKQILELEKVNIEPEFKGRLFDYITSIKKHRFSQFQENSYYLYNKLIKPVEKYFTDKSKLIIIPDDYLLYLPFSSLISQKQNDNQIINFSKLDYLIKDYEIVYQYSANLWLENFQTGQINNTTKGFFGIAPFSTNEIVSEIDSTNLSFLDKALPESVLRNITNSKNEYKSLPYSGKEINSIAKLFELQGISTKNLIDTDASEKNLKTFAKDFKYLHIATHGIINNIHPELSGLVFINDNNVSKDKEPDNKTKQSWKLEQNTDGILYAKEIFDLDLNAELVVLSACETGIGKLEKGEGVISLTRGFLYNRVPNVVFSLWKINDKNACDLMTDFYSNILQGKSYASALRHAKLNMISNKETAYPGNWAAFSLIGK